MATDSPKLIRFWQELKRRNVVRVITVYAASAFVILELVDIITEPFGLPDWTLKLVVVLLLVGLIVAVIFSWIYDIHPEGGMVKTKPAQGSVATEKQDTSRGWKIASYISFVIIIALIVFHFVARKDGITRTVLLDKSIAVLPFINDSPDQERMYFINGTMEEILDKLSKIEDLRVVSRNSVEQYRNNPKPTPEIAEEMNVSYVLEGSGQRAGNKIRLTVQLLDARKDRHIWSESYHREIEDIFDLQSEIAQLVAAEIKSAITPEETRLIEKAPTANLTAYDFYQRGQEENWTYLYTGDPENLERAEAFFEQALFYDSAYASAYAGLASVYWNKHYTESYLSEDFLDSVLILANHALAIDNQLSEAYVILGRYYTETGEAEIAIKHFNTALHYNPNHWEPLTYKAMLFSDLDLAAAIENAQQALLHNRGAALTGMLRGFSGLYANAGFYEKSKQLIHEALALDGDSLAHYKITAEIEESLGNYALAVAFLKKVLAQDSSDIDIVRNLGYNYLFLGHYKESLNYYEKYMENQEAASGQQYVSMHRIGYAYYGDGQPEKAEYYFDKQMEYCLAMQELERSRLSGVWIYYNMAGVYAVRGEREKAFENLRIFNQREMMPFWMVTLIRDDPLFNNLRSDPEFQQIVRDVEAKYQSEHERVRDWLAENDLL